MTLCSFIAAGLASVVGQLSCDPAGSETATVSEKGSAHTAAAPATPLQTVRSVHRYRVEGRLGMIEPYLAPEQRPYVMELLQAVDRLTAADGALREAVTRKFGRATADAFDHSQVANLVSVFSRDVEILDEKIEGDTAVVTIQVAKRVPLDEVHLVRSGERWRISTDPPIPGLAAELGRLADVLSATARRVTDGRLAADQLRREIDSQSASVRRRIAELTDPARPSAP